jgi:branched-chain amino acid transport system ATP-binding protein
MICTVDGISTPRMVNQKADNMELLEVEGITKRFGGLVAVHDLSLNVEPGEIVALIGPNGAGKTTAFNLISGFFKPDTGNIHYKNVNIVGLRPDQICKLGLARTFQVVRPFQGISVLDNIMVGAYARTNNPKEAYDKAYETMSFMGMSPVSGQLASGLPIAGRKRLEIARALATNPQLLLLDEAMAGLRPVETEEIISTVRKISDRGIGILLVEHVMRVVMSLAQKVIVLHHGEKLAEGGPEDIVKNQRVIDAYLGEAYVTN